MSHSHTSLIRSVAATVSGTQPTWSAALTRLVDDRDALLIALKRLSGLEPHRDDDDRELIAAREQAQAAIQKAEK